MIQLDETEQMIKDSLEPIMRGDWDERFDEKEIEMLRRRSFLLNHLTIDGKDFLFEHGRIRLKVTSQEQLEMSMYWSDATEHVLNTILNQKEFDTEYKAFARQYRIDSILKND